MKIRKYTQLGFLPISWINNNGIDIVFFYLIIHFWIYKKPSKKIVISVKECINNNIHLTLETILDDNSLLFSVLNFLAFPHSQIQWTNINARTHVIVVHESWIITDIKGCQHIKYLPSFFFNRFVGIVIYFI